VDRKQLVSWGLVALVSSAAGLASADESSGVSGSRKPVVEQLLDIMKANGSITAGQYDQLLEQARDEQRMAAAELQSADQAPAESEDEKFEVSTGWNGLRVESPDGAFKFRVGGRIQSDFAVYSQDQTPMGDGVQLRRGRIKTEGTMLSDWGYKLEVDFSSSGTVSVTDAFISYSGLDIGGVPLRITAGHLKVPFSQESMTSSNWQVFQERALIDALIDNSQLGRRRMGGIVESYGDHWSAALGVYGQGLASPGNSNESFGVAARAGFVPFSEERALLSINGAVYYRDLRADSGLRLRSKPESNVTSTRLVDTGTLTELGDILLFNASVTGVLGSFHAQAEYTGARVTRRRGMSNLYFGGFYVQAGYFLTGEERRYDARFGKYRRINPNNNFELGKGWGAWELAARFSQLDLQDRDVPGGREYDITAALNWYLNPSIMIRLNYVYANADPNSQVTLGGFDEHVNIFQGRMQVVF